MGQRLRLTESGFPPTGFPFGWQAHQIARKIHRCDYFGLTGRVMTHVSGLRDLPIRFGVCYVVDHVAQKTRPGARHSCNLCKSFWSRCSVPKLANQWHTHCQLSCTYALRRR